MDVYPSRRSTWLAIVVSAVFGVGGVGFLIADLATGPSWGDAWLLLAVPIFGGGIVAGVRQIRNPKPAVHLDGEGIEGAFGREPWSNVAGVSVHWRWQGRSAVRRLVLQLRTPDPDPAPTQRHFASGLLIGRAVTDDDRIEIPLWGRKAKVLDDVRRFYPVP